LWQCKCDWRPVDDPVTPEPERIVPPSKGLEGNPYQTGELITDKHPFFKDAPKWVERNAMLLLPDDLAFVKVETKYGDFLEHRLLNNEPEIAENRKIATFMIENGSKDIKLLPVISKLEVELRIRYFGEKYNSEFPTTNPDSIIDGKIIEFKSGKRTKLSRRILEGALQSDIVIIRSKDSLSSEYIARFIYDQWEMEDRKNLITIILINNNEILRFDRP